MPKKIKILTHRGLEPNNSGFYPESSYEAFENHLKRGFGIEFDVNFAKEGIIISHDLNLKNITNGEDERNFEEVKIEELKQIRYGLKKKGRISTFDELMGLIRNRSLSLNALHFKGKYQDKYHLKVLLTHLEKHKDILDKILIFDLKPETAKILKSIFPTLQLALSVSHNYDIQRYNTSVDKTLFSIEDAIEFSKQGFFDWVWLDEWDISDRNGLTKKLYTKEIFEKLRESNYKISLVTPELHGTSPGLHGGEFHQDAKDKEILFKRIKEIISLFPDALCTDYPEEVNELLV